MTVDGALIALISPYTVGESGSMTSANLTSYIALTDDELKRVPSAVSSTKRDVMQALLILDLFELKRGANLELKSESIGDYSYSRAEGMAGYTTWRAKFEQMLKTAMSDTKASEGVDRADVSGFPLDRNTTGAMI